MSRISDEDLERIRRWLVDNVTDGNTSAEATEEGQRYRDISMLWRALDYQLLLAKERKKLAAEEDRIANEERDELLAIVRALAAVRSPYDSQDGECWFCLTPMGRVHPDDCPHKWASAFLDRYSTIDPKDTP